MAAAPNSSRPPQRFRMMVKLPGFPIIPAPTAWAVEDRREYVERKESSTLNKHYNSLVLKTRLMTLAKPLPHGDEREDCYTYRLRKALETYDDMEVAQILLNFADCRIPHLTIPYIVYHLNQHPNVLKCLAVLTHFSGADFINERVFLQSLFSRTWPEAIIYLVGWTEWHEKYGYPFNKAFDQYGLYPIHLAACHGHLAACKLLHEYGADLSKVDNRGGTCLSMAAVSGNVETVQYFLSAGLNANHADLYKQTALHHAAFLGHVDVAKLLLEYGANPCAPDAWTRWPLQIAAERVKTDCVLAMLKYTSIKTVNFAVRPLVRTVLHYSAMNGDRVSVDAMLRYGHKADPVDIFGARPIDLTIDAKIKEVLEKRSRKLKPKPKK